MELRENSLWNRTLGKCLNRKNLILGAAFLGIMASLMTGLTLARYEDRETGFAAIEPARFYADLVADLTTYSLRFGTTPAKFGRLPANLNENELKFELMPGMEYEDEEGTLYFAVTNGNRAKHAEVPVEYTLQLITTRNLPLKVRLELLEDSAETANVGYTVDTSRSFTCDRAEATMDETLGNAYIYHFYEGEGTNRKEAEFILDEDNLNLYRYALRFEWPVFDEETGEYKNGAEYAKELEVIEVRALVKGDQRSLEENEYNAEEFYADAFVRFELPAAADLSAETAPSVKTAEYRLMDLESVTAAVKSGAGEDEETEKELLAFGFEVYNGEAGIAYLPDDILTKLSISYDVPADAGIDASGVRLFDEAEKQWYSLLEIDGAYWFADDAGKIKQFELRSFDYDASMKPIPKLAHRRFVLYIENDALRTLVQEGLLYPENLHTEDRKNDLKMLMNRRPITIHAEYALPEKEP